MNEREKQTIKAVIKLISLSSIQEKEGQIIIDRLESLIENE